MAWQNDWQLLSARAVHADRQPARTAPDGSVPDRRRRIHSVHVLQFEPWNQFIEKVKPVFGSPGNLQLVVCVWTVDLFVSVPGCSSSPAFQATVNFHVPASVYTMRADLWRAVLLCACLFVYCVFSQGKRGIGLKDRGGIDTPAAFITHHPLQRARLNELAGYCPKISGAPGDAHTARAPYTYDPARLFAWIKQLLI